MGDEVDMGGNSAAQLAGFIERIESLEAEKVEVTAKIKSEKELAKAAGFDPKVLNHLLKERKSDMQVTAEFRATVETYRKALGQFGDTELGEWASAFQAAQKTASQKRPPARTRRDDSGSGKPN